LMSAKVVRLKTGPQRALEAHARSALEGLEGAQGALPAELLAPMLTALRKIAPPAAPKDSERLNFTMLSDQVILKIWDAIEDLPPSERPHKVLRTFNIALACQDWESGIITLTREQLAEKVRCSPGTISRVMGTLERLGVIVRHCEAVPGLKGPGKAVYRVNPHVAFKGPVETWQEAKKAAKRPQLALVRPSSK
jgi:hypothetical protein